MKFLKLSLLAIFAILAARLIRFIGEPDYFRVGEQKIDNFLEKILLK